MDDIIRKAVELAEGWQWVGERLPAYIRTEFGEFDPEEEPQWVKDALAAQLVRQVDALKGCLELVVQDGESGIWDQANCITCAMGDDRTDNTLRAIVESGVLSPTQEVDDE